MAGAGPSTWPWSLLLLSLLSLSWAPTRAWTGVLVPPQVHGFLGDNATLQCKLQTQEHDKPVTLVTWMWQDLAGHFHNVAVFHPTLGTSYPGDLSFPALGRVEFAAARRGEKLQDASLTVRGLLARDEANYTCQITTFPHGSKSTSTWLRVLAKPQNTVQTEEALLSSLGQEPVPVAHCVSLGGRPPARISWSLDGKVTESQVPGPLPGTFTVTSLLSLRPSSQVDGKNVTCTVEHESFEKPVLLPVTLTVPYPPEVSISGYDDHWYLGQRGATLNCAVRSNPEPTDFAWSTAVGPLPPSAVAQGAHLLIRFVDKSVNTTFICYVSNALGTGKAEQTILVMAEPPWEESHPKDRDILILSVVLVLVGLAMLGFLVYLRWFKPSLDWECQQGTARAVTVMTVSPAPPPPTQVRTDAAPSAAHVRRWLRREDRHL